MLQVVANDGEVVFQGVDTLELADAFNGTLLQRMATDGIHRVGGTHQQRAIVQQLDDFGYIARRIVLFVEFLEHILFYII